MASTGEVEKVDAIQGTSLGERFDTQPNALNFLRLVLALEVIVWHAYALPGGTWLPGPVEAFLGDIAVDGFFAISGFLIVRAWCRNPDPPRFLMARAARILPGLWVCLLVTGFLVAPILSAVTPAGVWGYVLGNADTWGTRYTIDGGPVINGSLWSLGYETACYLAVLGLGMSRLLGARSVAVVAVACWATAAGFASAGVNDPLVPVLAARCGLMFAVGALAWFHRDRIPVTGRLAAAATLVLVGGVVVSPDYRLVAAPAVAYLCLAGGVALGRHRRLVLKHDLSYGVYVYGFPIQQALLAVGVSLGWAGFAVVSMACVAPVAALSWFLVEGPVQRRARHLTRARHRAASVARPGSTQAAA